MTADKKRPEILIVYHSNCMDGLCAAWICWKKWGPHAEYLPMRYDQAEQFDPGQCAGRTVYVLDFSFPPEKTLAIAEVARRLVWLDHHRTAIEAWGERDVPANCEVVLDETRSGARLTWRHFYGNQPCPWLVDYTEDRDLWLWRLPQSRQVNAAIRAREQSFAELDRLDMTTTANALARDGAAILMDQAKMVAMQCCEAREEEIGGYVVPCVNCTTLTSETLEILCRGRLFAVAWREGADGRKHWSLRSDGGPGAVDVSIVAQQYGGGGHPQAAGFVEAASQTAQ